MVTITYDGTNPFDGLAPTPLVGRSLVPTNQRQRKYLLDSLVLQGQITGVCSGGFNESYQKFETLLNRFSQNFKRLKIIDGTNVVYDAPYSVVRSISVSDEKWYGIIPFSIEIDLYQSGFFSGDFGVIDCSNQFDFQENKDCTVSVTHTISAQGVNTNLPAITNARNYVSGQTGWSNQVLPHLIDDPDQMILLSVSERSNRLEGSHELVENWIYSPANLASPNSGLLKYTLNLSADDNSINVGLEGEIIGGRTVGISGLRNTISNVDFYSLCNGYYSDFATGSLNTTPINLQATENVSENKISFSVEYSNSIEDTSPYLVDSVAIETDHIADRTCLSFDGEVRSLTACGENRWAEVVSFYNNLNLQTKLQNIWNTYGSGTINWTPTSQTYGENKIDNILTFGVEYCSDNGQSIGTSVDNFVYTLNFNPGITQYVAKPILNGQGQYCIQNLGFRNRARYSIQGSARATECCNIETAESNIKAKLNQLSSDFFTGRRKVLISQSIEREENRVITFSAEWTAEDSDIIPDSLK